MMMIEDVRTLLVLLRVRRSLPCVPPDRLLKVLREAVEETVRGDLPERYRGGSFGGYEPLRVAGHDEVGGEHGAP